MESYQLLHPERKNLSMQKIYPKPLFLFFTFLFLCLNGLSAQELLESRRTSPFTYIYEITDQEAKLIYTTQIVKLDSTFFHTKIDSFPTEKTYSKTLPPGHYLKTFSYGGEQKIEMASVRDFNIYSLNNTTDLDIQIYDLEGNIIDDAEVRVNEKELKYSRETHSFTDKKSNEHGIVSVTHDGITSYYKLDRQMANSGLSRAYRKTFYGTPLKYIWQPINFILDIPLDGFRSIKYGWPQGTIYSIKRFFVNAYEKTACIFDPYYCEFNDKYTGYMAFNKPMYKPGDTVKVKAFIVDKNGKPLKKDVRVKMTTDKNRELMHLTPYRNGGYSFQFHLHDSLKMKLDRYYTVSLTDGNWNTYYSGGFKYEEYELKSIDLTLRSDKNEHYNSDTLTIFARGFDENDLNIFDGRLEITAITKNTTDFFSENLFVPDTLFQQNIPLKQTGETEINIPSTYFPKANIEYEVQVRLLTSDNETIIEEESFKYFHSRNHFTLSLSDDSLTFRYYEDLNQKEIMASIYSEDHFGNQKLIDSTSLPVSLPISPYIERYILKSKDKTQFFSMNVEDSGLKVYSSRDSDSIYIDVQNPKNIPFTYHIYKRNTEKKSGYSEKLKFSDRTHTKNEYFLSLQYLWAGRMVNEDYSIPLTENELTITVDGPSLVYPGQKAEITVSVTDVDGDPVQGVDLTAYSITSKFKDNGPDVPSFEKQRKGKELINKFTVRNDIAPGYLDKKLDYDTWKTLAGLDSIEYYKFLYPGEDMYRTDFYMKDSLTQFAPYVINEGQVEPIQVIYVDNTPIYFAWNTIPAPYSFKISSGFHKITLRTATNEITLQHVAFMPGKKLIFSLDKNQFNNENVTIEETKPFLSENEKRFLYPYILSYKNTFHDKFTFITDQDQIYLLNMPGKRTDYNNYSGPVSGSLKLTSLENFETRFFYERNFNYEFKDGLIKMREWNEGPNYPNILKFSPSQRFDHSIINEDSVIKWKEQYKEQLKLSNRKYNNPVKTFDGYGRLKTEIANSARRERDVLNVLLFKSEDADFVRIYPGNSNFFHQLDSGYYKLVHFYTGSYYREFDSLKVTVNGLNYARLDYSKEVKKDSFSVKVNKLIETAIYNRGGFYDKNDPVRKEITNTFLKEKTYTGSGTRISGIVKDKSGEGIPGVNVVVKGTNQGTVTDIQGQFNLTIPSGFGMVVVSSVGYATQEIPVDNSFLDVELQEDVSQLQEVVVTAYAVERNKKSLGYSVTTLQGKVAGVNLLAAASRPGSSDSLVIRGNSSLSGSDKPLIVIDGVIFNGDLTKIDKDKIGEVNILKSEAATALYGARAANGVMIITTKGFSGNPAPGLKNSGAEFDNGFLESSLQSSSIRSNFSDYAFWQPELHTDKNGKATFEITFPDDVTKWNTVYLAMNSKRQSGKTTGQIKSYKPVMAQLSLPRFLVEGDEAIAIGKAKNYTVDTLQIQTRFELNDEEIFNKNAQLINANIDSLRLIGKGDSLKAKYYLEKEDGYFDGEERKIRVYKKGIEETEGNFYALRNDTSITLSFDPDKGPVKIHARADLLEVFEDEAIGVSNYRYLCNEQIASKIKSLLALKKINDYQEKEFKYDSKINKLVKKLMNNQKASGFWGWWKNSPETIWISMHVIEALHQAQEEGYNVELDPAKLSQTLIWKLKGENTAFSQKIRILKTLTDIDTVANYKDLINELDMPEKYSMGLMLDLMLLKQKAGIVINMDTLNSFKKETIFGNIYFTDRKDYFRSIYDNDIQNTLKAYQIYSNDTIDENKETLQKITGYVLEKRKNRYWTNTFESSRIIETIVPTLLDNKEESAKPELTFRGGLDSLVTTFPFNTELEVTEPINVSKTGDFPVYLSGYQNYWNDEPEKKGLDFEVTSTFKDNSTNILEAGKETTLKVTITVKKASEYVMINIPIPAGCSYVEKKQNHPFAVHTEYFKNEATIFCQRLPEGTFTYEIKLTPRFSGSYSLNPAKIELMYFPTFNANEKLKSIVIE
ncbi:carboxypeptidase-like regulatory domain-containing protein [Mangrovivirga sp. M17]|uniref:Carboxypeptidase-like regulatory domain-containing protein n=1 Tax=Mangrovivirga halotolerans TaxID=2993936 RepID=A0ABT3RM69_9BACT|nr:carboxypeptidase-like regulatory domain-containing protein [Mangrovivirga halotolerans]MCX2742666.1 carboxypeptidase-like regulatory domain-containing protein [Mangrovivirga halotolerans]